MRGYKLPALFAVLAALLAAALACRPILAIGTGELVILILVIALLLGPLLFRLYRFLARLQDIKDTDRKGK
jgi:fatty acid desaturase